MEKRVEGLSVEPGEGGELRISGTLLPGDVRAPLLLTGVDLLAPVEWAGKRFLFVVPRALRTAYVRIGYESVSGDVVITDVITSPRGTVSPEAGSRF